MSHLLPQLPFFLAVLFRVAGLFIFAPVLSSPAVPARIRALLAIMFAVAVFPSVPMSSHPGAAIPGDILSLLAWVGAEALIGVTIGLLASLPIYAVQLGGVIAGQQVGFGLGVVYNPALDTESDALSQLLLFAAVASFLLIGGLDAAFISVVSTFERLPPGSAGLALAPLDLATGLVTSGFELALRIAAPVLGIVMLETVAAAIFMKTIPQINFLSVGFAIKIIASLSVLVASAAAMHEAASADIMNSLGIITEWARSLPFVRS